MEIMKIDGTKKTPQIDFDLVSGILQLKGRSVPEDTYQFYMPIMTWIEEFGKNKPPSITVKISLDYFNTSSSKFLLELLKKIKVIKITNNCDLKIEWFYESDDDEMLQSGQDFMELLDIPFEFISL